MLKILFFNIELPNEEMEKVTVLDKNKRFNAYRWLLLNMGGCYLAEPWIFDLKELEENYTFFEDAYEEYMSGCEHGKAFPVGGLGDGSIVFIDLESGKVRGYNNDYTDLEEIAESFSELILDLVEQVESCS